MASSLRVWAWAMAAAVLMLAGNASVLLAQQVENPAYKAWANFKVGSSSTLSCDMSSATGANMNMQMEMTQKLVELTDDHATIETVVTMNIGGQSHTAPARQSTISAKTEKSDWKEVGTEDVKAAGKTISCKVFEGSRSVPSRAGNTEVHGKYWTSSDVPGGLVQMKVGVPTPNGATHELTYLLKDFEAK